MNHRAGWMRSVQLGCKRGLDIAGSTILLVVLSPLFLLIAILIKLTSPGPVFYRQTRVGHNGKLFKPFKFRSMVVGAERMGLGIAVAKSDSRITPVGAWLRKLSLDELPQLINVLIGDMSLVGPRPTVESQVREYDAWQRRRLEMKPGMTGWAQVNGRNSIPWEERIRLDIWYIDHWSLWLDFLCIVRTIPAVLFSKEEDLYGAGGVTPEFKGASSTSEASRGR